MFRSVCNRMSCFRMVPAALLALVMNVSGVATAKNPNVVLIVSDDQGYNDLGVLGNGIVTPALDRLVQEGTRLNNFYVAWPACTPSRAAFLTGSLSTAKRDLRYDSQRGSRLRISLYVS